MQLPLSDGESLKWGYGDRVISRRAYRWKKWSAVLGVLILFCFTVPYNQSEAEDGYDFARRVEQGTFADQTGVNRLLALPIFGAAYDAAQAVGYSGRAFTFMLWINRLMAAACVLMFRSLLEAMSIPCSAGTAGGSPPGKDQTCSLHLQPALCLTFSYGFWRYANAAETYMLAMFLLLGAWLLALKGRWILSAVVSGLGVLVHLLNAIPLLFVIPLFYLLQSRDWRRAFVHGGIAGSVVAAGYLACAPLIDWGGLGAQHHSIESGFRLSNLLRGAVAFGQNIVSGNFLFGFEAFRSRLAGLFPSRMFGEEFYMGRQMPPWLPWAGVLTLTAAALVMLWYTVTAFRGLRSRPPAQRDDPSRRATQTACLVWLLLYAAVVIHTEAGSPELWIPALVPFWLLLVPLINAASRNRPAVAVLLPTVLLVHNLIGGLLPVLPEDSDYHRAKGAWLVENCTAQDAIWIDYEPVMIFYLEYFTPAQIVSSHTLQTDQIGTLLGSVPGKVYAPASFFEPMEAMRIRSPEMYDHMRAVGGQFRPLFRKEAEDAFGGVFVMMREESADE